MDLCYSVKLSIPRPRKPPTPVPCSSKSHLTTSLQASQQLCGLGELQQILRGGGGSPPATFLGVSPPARAANPLAHSSSWKCRAWSASANNLQALRELDANRSSAGGGAPPPFLQHCDGGLDALLQQARRAPEPPSSWNDVGPRPTPFSCTVQYYVV